MSADGQYKERQYKDGRYKERKYGVCVCVCVMVYYSATKKEENPAICENMDES